MFDLPIHAVLLGAYIGYWIIKPHSVTANIFYSLPYLFGRRFEVSYSILDEECCYELVEPGVSYYEYLRGLQNDAEIAKAKFIEEHKLNLYLFAKQSLLWLSVAGIVFLPSFGWLLLGFLLYVAVAMGLTTYRLITEYRGLVLIFSIFYSYAQESTQKTQ